MGRGGFDTAEMQRLARGMAQIDSQAKADLRWLIAGKASGWDSAAHFRRHARRLLHDPSRKVGGRLRVDLLEWAAKHGLATRSGGDDAAVTSVKQSVRWTPDEWARIEQAAEGRDTTPYKFVKSAVHLLLDLELPPGEETNRAQ